MKHLLPQKKYYKANLHNHTVVSDGTLTPEESRDAYKAQGYSILAHTDHSVTVAHQNLNQPDFLMITGIEIDIEEEGAPRGENRCRHLCLLSKDPNRQWAPFKDPFPIPASVPYEAGCEFGGVPRIYDYDAMNKVIAACNAEGFLVTYNHPVWSLENYADYANMEGLWGVEYRNTGCIASGYDENNGQVYQDFLRMGKFLMPVMADDTHAPVEKGKTVLGGSWNMVAADRLEYGAVMEALEKGDLYASCGPEIHSLTVDGNILKITCSPAAQIQLISQARWCRLAEAKDAPLTEAEFDISIWLNNYSHTENCFLRLIVTDATGKYAVTRAYRGKEIKE